MLKQQHLLTKPTTAQRNTPQIKRRQCCLESPPKSEYFPCNQGKMCGKGPLKFVAAAAFTGLALWLPGVGLRGRAGFVEIAALGLGASLHGHRSWLGCRKEC